MRRKKLTSRKSIKSSIVVRKTESAGIRWLDCKECGVDGAYCTMDVKAVTCSLCVSKQAAPPETPKHLQVKTDDEKRPRGWQFMNEYISPSGKTYHKGKEVNDAARPTVRTPKQKKEPTVKAASPTTGTGRKRGRPKSNPVPTPDLSANARGKRRAKLPTENPRKRGRPRKLP